MIKLLRFDENISPHWSKHHCHLTLSQHTVFVEEVVVGGVPRLQLLLRILRVQLVPPELELRLHGGGELRRVLPAYVLGLQLLLAQIPAVSAVPQKALTSVSLSSIMV